MVTGPGAQRRLKGNLGGCLVYEAKWRFGYRLRDITQSNMQSLMSGKLWGVVIKTKNDPRGLKMGGGKT